MSVSNRLQAIELRRQGASYRQLRAQFGIAKSTLWRWLKAGGVVETCPQRLTDLKRLAQQKGAAVVKARRIERTRVAMSAAAQSSLQFRIYLHETADPIAARIYWATELNCEAIQAAPVTWKRHKPTRHRYNTGAGYHGLLRVRVPKSTDLNRRIAGWIDGMSLIGESSKGRTRDFDSRYPGSSPGSPASVAERAMTSYATQIRNRIFGRDRWDGGLLQEVEAHS